MFVDEIDIAALPKEIGLNVAAYAPIHFLFHPMDNDW